MIRSRSGVSDKDLGWSRLMAAVKQVKGGPHVKVGVPDDGSERKEGDVLTNGELAAIHELGTQDGRIPARPWIGGAFDNHRQENIEFLTALLRKVYDGDRGLSIEQSLGLLGQKFQANVKNYVTIGNNLEKLSDATVAQKGSSRPLIDTARMVGSVVYIVVMQAANIVLGKVTASDAD